MGLNSRTLAEQYFSIDNVIYTHLHIYETLLEK